jgi:anti-anti-sigma regulatory factor
MAEPAVKTVALPPVVDLDALDGVRDRLLEVIETGPVRINGAAVERVATNALLMLLSAADTARKTNFAFEIAGPSAAMTGAIDRLGLTPRFAPMIRGL